MEKKAMTTKVAELLMTDAKDVLLMLGIETEFSFEEENGKVYIESKPISMTPRMFKELTIKGRIFYTGNFYHDELPEVTIDLEYRYKHFNGGYNGVNLARIKYYITDDIGEKVETYGLETALEFHTFSRFNTLLGV